MGEFNRTNQKAPSANRFFVADSGGVVVADGGRGVVSSAGGEVVVVQAETGLMRAEGVWNEMGVVMGAMMVAAVWRSFKSVAGDY